MLGRLPVGAPGSRRHDEETRRARMGFATCRDAMSPVGAPPYFPGGREEEMERPATCREGFLDNGKRNASAIWPMGPPDCDDPLPCPENAKPGSDADSP